jgi:uncharacterized protein YecE (DUF72 family)
MPLFVGCAGWTIPKAHSERFDGEGSHLVRYARQLTAVEINSSFYKPHRPATYAKWAESVPSGFAFSAKVPKEITHVRKLANADAELERFLGEVSALGPKLGPLLVQLPPSLGFEPAIAEEFWTALRGRFQGDVVCEPRHATWFANDAHELLVEHKIARVAADPALHGAASAPGGWQGLAYYRWHGSPRVYYSDYSEEQLQALAAEVLPQSSSGTPVWCIFDNTALGAATGNALRLLELLRHANDR